MGLSPLQVRQVARTSGVDIRNKRVRFLQFFLVVGCLSTLVLTRSLCTGQI